MAGEVEAARRPPDEDSFAGMLSSLLTSCKWVALAGSLGSLASGEASPPRATACEYAAFSLGRWALHRIACTACSAALFPHTS